MADRSLYDDDIYAWSQQQAEALRELARRDSSNNVDWDNVIEEVEGVGETAVQQAEDDVRDAFTQLFIYLSSDGSDSLRQRIAYERLVSSVFQLEGHLTTTMRSQIRLDMMWRHAKGEAARWGEERGFELRRDLPERCPFSLDDFFPPAAGVGRLTERFAHTASS